MPTLLFLLLSVLTHPTQGQTITLSKEADISIITCSPWQGELYAAFGHSAIHIYDSQKQLNHVFNYGIFDYNQPNFYLNFIKGNLWYELGVQSYEDFIMHYIHRNIAVREQLLNLPLTTKQRLFDYLVWNARPNNKTYTYDYFYNNCSTKIRDILVNACGESIHFDSTLIKTSYTIRNLTDLYLTQQPWGDLSIDIFLGLPMDKKAHAYEYMYIPEFLESFLDHASIMSHGKLKPLVKSKLTVFTPQVIAKNTATAPHPWIVFGILFLITVAVSVYDYRRKKLSMWLDAVWLVATGIVGCAIIFCWTATNHQAGANNFNLLWAIPLNLIIAPFIGWNKAKSFVLWYFKVTSIISAVLLLTWSWLPQEINIFILPIAMALTLRYVLNATIRQTNKIGTKI